MICERVALLDPSVASVICAPHCPISKTNINSYRGQVDKKHGPAILPTGLDLAKYTALVGLVVIHPCRLTPLWIFAVYFSLHKLPPPTPTSHNAIRRRKFGSLRFELKAA